MATIALTMWQCPSCHGVYPDPQLNGQRYYHVCPPMSRPELEALGPLELQALYAAHSITPTLRDALEQLELVGIERANHRNENIAPAYRGETLRPGQTSDEAAIPRISWGEGRTSR